MERGAPPVVAQKYAFFHLDVVFFADLANELFQPLIKRRHEHLPPVFETPDHMLVTGIEHVSVALVGRLIHKISMQHCAIYVKSVCSRCFPAPSPAIWNAPFIPMDESQGLSGAESGKPQAGSRGAAFI